MNKNINKIKKGDKVKVIELINKEWVTIKTGIVMWINSAGAKVYDPDAKYDSIEYPEWFPFDGPLLKMRKIGR